MSISSDLIANKDRILSVVSDIKSSLINRGISDVSDVITDYPGYINSITQTNASKIRCSTRFIGFTYTLTSVKANDVIETIVTPSGGTNEYFTIDTTNNKIIALKRCAIIIILGTHVGTNTLNSNDNYVLSSVVLNRNGTSEEYGDTITIYNVGDTIDQNLFQIEAGDEISVKVIVSRPTAAASSNAVSPLVSVFASVHRLYDS